MDVKDSIVINWRGWGRGNFYYAKLSVIFFDFPVVKGFKAGNEFFPLRSVPSMKGIVVQGITQESQNVFFFLKFDTNT